MHIRKLFLMAGLHFIAMYFLMFAMVDGTSDIFLNTNTAYMAALMTAPMLLIEGVLMGDMYKPKQLLIGAMVLSALVALASYISIRQQIGIADQAFLRSMIPHHSGAILMCEEADLRNAEIQELCDSIIESQKEEIAQMKALLE